MQTPNAAADYAVRVDPEAQHWTWSVTRSETVTARGAAPDRETALRSGQFAAAAVDALDRVSRRWF